MKRFYDNNYEQGYYTGFCQHNLNSEIKPGKNDYYEPFGSTLKDSLNTISDTKRIDSLKGKSK